MGATLTHSCPLTYLENNLSALKSLDPQSLASIRDAELPAELELTNSRDGTQTYTWLNADAKRQWLGRTTMPAVRAQALIDAFSPGEGNVIFFGIGLGSEIRRLLDRLAPRQALFVLEPDMLAAKLCLALHDFSLDLKSGRLIPLVGDDCWRHLEQFLMDNPGYLAPDRMLSWPWFDHAEIHQITQRLSQVCQQIALKRNMCRQALKFSALSSGESQPNIALLAFASHASSDDWARGLEWAAGHSKVHTQRYDHNRPHFVHPLATELQLGAQKPSHVFQVDIPAADLKLQVPPARSVLLISTRGEFASGVLEQLPAGTIVTVRTDAQFSSARATATGRHSILRIPPAARVTRTHGAPRADRIVVVADRIDFSAHAAGLHLASHCSIYDAAEQSVMADIDNAHIGNANDYLNAALKRLGMKLTSNDVRKGLCDRIEQILIPGLMSREYESMLSDSGLEIHIAGRGREGAAYQSTDEICEDAQIGLVLFVHPQRYDACVILDAIAAGIMVALRGSRPQDFDFLEGTLGSLPIVPTFETRKDAIGLVQEFDKDPAGFRSRWAHAQQHVLESQLWTHRLDAILQSCNGE